MKSAVVVLIEEATDSLILTERSPHLRKHPGEICFPGGHWQPGDASLWDTALRELEEELGINRARIRLVKPLAIEHTHAGTLIQPWLATIQQLEPYKANSAEVAAVHTLPMQDIKIVNNYQEVTVRRFEKTIKTCQFTASRYFVWGATARIMKQLC